MFFKQQIQVNNSARCFMGSTKIQPLKNSSELYVFVSVYTWGN